MHKKLSILIVIVKKDPMIFLNRIFTLFYLILVLVFTKRNYKFICFLFVHLAKHRQYFQIQILNSSNPDFK